MGLADKIVVKFGKGKPAPAMDGAPEDAEDMPDKSEDKPGMKGKMLAAALKRGDGEAIEEAVKAICE